LIRNDARHPSAPSSGGTDAARRRLHRQRLHRRRDAQPDP